ncbi:hypothetical protein CCYA_CCYA09G2627 [Cyanidiococcus yangmingshanensis]|nr:hypothetical protein CCYA_CCYA09G2627 [Cyanidiococcus yangmingshanensis]
MLEAYADAEAIARLALRLCAEKWRRLVCRFDAELLDLGPRLVWHLQEQLWQLTTKDDQEIEFYLSLDQTGPMQVEEVSGLRAASDAMLCFQASMICRRVQSALPVVYVNQNLEIVPPDLVLDQEWEGNGPSERFLRRRLSLLSRLRDEARIFGLVTINLSLPHCLEAVAQVRQLLQTTKRNVYSFHMTSITPVKLANFAEIDAFVLFSDSKYFMELESKQTEFWKPILTPYEVCLMSSVEDEVELASKCINPALYTFDLQVVATWHLPTPTETKLSNRVERPETEVAPSTVASFAETAVLPANQAYGYDFAGGRLQQRSWRGLDASEAAPPPHRAVTGRTGRAGAYTDELDRLRGQHTKEHSDASSPSIPMELDIKDDGETTS